MATKAAPRKKVAAKKRATKQVVVTYVLDETASMLSVRDATISGFNEYLKTLRATKSDARMTLLTFNSAGVVVRYSGKPLKDVSDLGPDYRPSQNTPLYDAIGRAIHDTDLVAKKTGADAIFIIHTDGEENASREYTRDMIFQLIEDRKAKGWAFVFLGADQDAWRAAISLGIPVGSTISYDHDPFGTRASMQAAGAHTMSYMSANETTRASLAVKGLSSTAVDLRKKKSR